MNNEIKENANLLDKIKLGDHVCSIYKDKKEQFSPIIPFLERGLENNQKCIYIADENSKEEVTSALKNGGIDIEKYLNSGQFLILTKRETYLRDGIFDPDKMIAFLKETESDVLKEGYAGMRVTGEMTWVLEGVEGSEKLIEYEAKLNDFFPGSKSAAICQYNENKFEKVLLLEVIHTHPIIIVYGNLYENNLYFSPFEYKKDAHRSLPVSSYELIRDDIINSI